MAKRVPSAARIERKSVTKNDFNENPYQGYGAGIYQFLLPYTPHGTGDLPAYWSPIRDRVLKTTPLRESMWASAIGIATSKVSAADWRVEGRKVKYWQDLIKAADNNQSYTTFEEKQIRDYLLTENGTHFEIIRTNDAAGARIIGIKHLPSWRCIRTGVVDTPIIYCDRRGIWHEMREYQVVSMADEADADDIFFGTGHCAASRAWNAILRLSALELYVYEKVSGKEPNRIYLVNASINEKQLQNAMTASAEHANEKGYVAYQGAIMIPVLDPGANASVDWIDLKGLPENFDADKERIHAMLTYADAIGIDPVDIDPNLAARGRALGSGSQAQVLDDKQQGKGLISYFKKKAYLFNEYLLPDRVTFSFGNSDLADSARLAGILQTHVQSVREAVGKGKDLPIITPEQAKQLLVKLGDIPPSFLMGELSDEEVLDDNDKPDVLDVEQIEPIDAKLMLKEPPPEPAPMLGQKPKPKAKQSLNAYWAEKAYEDHLNKAQVWLSELSPFWYLMSDEELLELYPQPMPTPVAKQAIVRPTKQKEAALPPQVIIHQPPAQQLHLHMPEMSKELAMPNITVQAPNVTVEPAQFTIQLPEQPAPIVTVQAPNVTITNEVPVPSVSVENQPANVNVDVSPTPVNIKVEPTPVTVDNKVHVDAPQRERLIVHRNARGQIDEIDAE